jgi:hypothetical protein
MYISVVNITSARFRPTPLSHLILSHFLSTLHRPSTPSRLTSTTSPNLTFDFSYHILHIKYTTSTSSHQNYHHAGIAYQENSSRINISRASLASLPGGLRNITYAAPLKWSQPNSITYDPTTRRFQTSGVKRLDDRTPVEALSLLSSLDHNIHTEARSYFFMWACTSHSSRTSAQSNSIAYAGSDSHSPATAKQTSLLSLKRSNSGPQ